MVYTQAFFDLQLQFACKIMELSGLSLPCVLLKYTNLYIRFGLGRDFHPTHPIWQTYLTGLENAHDPHEWTYHFYLSRAKEMSGPPVVATFGCFSYALLPEGHLRLHFQNTDTEEHSSLSHVYVNQRRADLTALFQHVQHTVHEGVQVIGRSWLYNLEAYRRLFPASYIATAHAIRDRFYAMSLWGQFLDRSGGIKETMRRPFLARLERQTHVEHLHQCFPLQTLTVEAPVQAFYDCYGIESPYHPND